MFFTAHYALNSTCMENKPFVESEVKIGFACYDVHLW